jgi:hypothetical protein
MKTLRAILGYVIAGLSVPIVIFVLMTMMNEDAVNSVVEATGLTLAPSISGGEVVQTVEHGIYRAEVHRMVFDGFLGQRREGFVQVDWAPLDNLPAQIEEEVDADQDGRADFKVQVDTAGGSATLSSQADWVVGVEGPHSREESLAVRVHLKNPAR